MRIHKAKNGWPIFYYERGFTNGELEQPYMAPGYDIQYVSDYRKGYDAGVEKAKLNKLRNLVLGNDSI